MDAIRRVQSNGFKLLEYPIIWEDYHEPFIGLLNSSGLPPPCLMSSIFNVLESTNDRFPSRTTLSPSQQTGREYEPHTFVGGDMDNCDTLSEICRDTFDEPRSSRGNNTCIAPSGKDLLPEPVTAFRGGSLLSPIHNNTVDEGNPFSSVGRGNWLEPAYDSVPVAYKSAENILDLALEDRDEGPCRAQETHLLPIEEGSGDNATESMQLEQLEKQACEHQNVALPGQDDLLVPTDVHTVNDAPVEPCIGYECGRPSFAPEKCRAGHKRSIEPSINATKRIRLSLPVATCALGTGETGVEEIERQVVSDAKPPLPSLPPFPEHHLRLTRAQRVAKAANSRSQRRAFRRKNTAKAGSVSMETNLLEAVASQDTELAAKEKGRIRNREAVRKCRRRTAERLSELEKEKLETDVENQRMREIIAQIENELRENGLDHYIISQS